jgi:hypothetical protein
MKEKLEPGDLAIIIKSTMGMSIGKIVECVQLDYVGHPQFGTIWLVSSPKNDLVSEYGGIGATFHVPQDWLRKIPKDPLPDEDLYSTEPLEGELVPDLIEE